MILIAHPAKGRIGKSREVAPITLEVSEKTTAAAAEALAERLKNWTGRNAQVEVVVRPAVRTSDIFDVWVYDKSNSCIAQLTIKEEAA